MKAIGQMQALLGNGDQHVRADRDPDLRIDRVLVGAIKRLDTQVLRDLFEKQFNLPTLAEQVRYNASLRAKLLVEKVFRLPISSLMTARRSVAG